MGASSNSQTGHPPAAVGVAGGHIAGRDTGRTRAEVNGPSGYSLGVNPTSQTFVDKPSITRATLRTDGASLLVTTNAASPDPARESARRPSPSATSPARGGSTSTRSGGSGPWWRTRRFGSATTTSLRRSREAPRSSRRARPSLRRAPRRPTSETRPNASTGTRPCEGPPPGCARCGVPDHVRRLSRRRHGLHRRRRRDRRTPVQIVWSTTPIKTGTPRRPLRPAHLVPMARSPTRRAPGTHNRSDLLVPAPARQYAPV